MITLLKTLNRFPPFLCRMVARTGRGRKCRALTSQEIADRSGLDPSTVSKLSRKRTWSKESLWVIDRFSSACGVDLLHPRRHIDLLKRHRLAYLRTNGDYYRRLLKGESPHQK